MQNFEIRYTCQEITNLKYCKVGFAQGASLILLFWKFCDLKQNIAIIDLQTLKLFLVTKYLHRYTFKKWNHVWNKFVYFRCKLSAFVLEIYWAGT